MNQRLAIAYHDEPPSYLDRDDIIKDLMPDIQRMADRLARKFPNSGESAEDLVQEAVLHVVRKGILERDKAIGGELGPYILKICYTRMIDIIGQKKRKITLMASPEIALFLQSGDNDNPEFTTRNAQVRTLVEEALAALPPDYQETLELKYFHGLTRKEIAQAVREDGEPAPSDDTINMRTFRAKESLAIALAERGLTQEDFL